MTRRSTKDIGFVLRSGWSAIDGTSGLTRAFRHGSGFEVHRVPHPTANYPWYGLVPGDRPDTAELDNMIRMFGIGRGMAFRNAETAMYACERVAETWTPGAVITWDEPCPHPREAA